MTCGKKPVITRISAASTDSPYRPSPSGSALHCTAVEGLVLGTNPLLPASHVEEPQHQTAETNEADRLKINVSWCLAY
jgi:hypothetical protein